MLDGNNITGLEARQCTEILTFEAPYPEIRLRLIHIYHSSLNVLSDTKGWLVNLTRHHHTLGVASNKILVDINWLVLFKKVLILLTFDLLGGG